MNEGEARDVQVGDCLELNDVRCLVTEIHQFPGFREMLKAVGWRNAMPEARSLRSALAAYHSFGNGSYEERSRKSGVMAFTLRLPSA